MSQISEPLADLIASVQYKSAHQGGRSTPVYSGDRSMIKFEQVDILTSANPSFPDQVKIEPGEGGRAHLKLTSPSLFRRQLKVGMRFAIKEPPHTIGTGVVREILNPELSSNA